VVSAVDLDHPRRALGELTLPLDRGAPIGRRKQPDIAQQLLDACTDFTLEHGLPDRLAPFARVTGASNRMLLYHFGTRDGLRRAVLVRARERQRAEFGELLRMRADESYVVTLRRAWSQMTGPRGRPFLDLFGQLREDAEQQLWPGFRREATTDWLGPLDIGMRSRGLPDQATLMLAVIRGLIMDLDATGDAHRIERAFHEHLHAVGVVRPG
jgi:AcrR family transcriptional regulator